MRLGVAFEGAQTVGGIRDAGDPATTARTAATVCGKSRSELSMVTTPSADAAPTALGKKASLGPMAMNWKGWFNPSSLACLAYSTESPG